MPLEYSDVFLKRFFEPSIAQVSYLVGCTSAREAIVIDPHRDVAQYLDAAEAEGLRITHVTETHIHADFVSGSLELAHRAGARVCISEAGGAVWEYAFAGAPNVVRMKPGHQIAVGRVRLDVEHTPGHTPEHVTFLVTDTEAATAPIGAATGDFLFVGDVGRPDLLERAVHMQGTTIASAQTLFASLRRFAEQPDWMQIWPGHGAGSPCGKSIGAMPQSTLGYERRFNWAFGVATEGEFVRRVLEGQPDPPPYFAAMKRVNQAGPRPLGALPQPRALDASELGTSDLAEDVTSRPAGASTAVLVDSRAPADFAMGHVPGSLNIPSGPTLVTWAGWLVAQEARIRLIVDGAGAAAARSAAMVARDLALIGLDRVEGYFDVTTLDEWFAAGHRPETTPQIEARDLAESLRHGGVTLIDVRTELEFGAAHIRGAQHVPLGHLSDQIDQIPRGRPVVVQCQGGGRSAIAASLLRERGVPTVINFAGGLPAWTRAGLPVVS